MRNTVLAIAATDSSNGAGVTADIATLDFFGARAVAAVTAVTAQNLDGAAAADPVRNRIFTKELEALTAPGMPEIGAVKIGLIPNDKILRTAITFIRERKKLNPGLKVIWDPVTAAGAGGRLSEVSYAPWLRVLLPLVDLFTPNLPEAAALCGAAPDPSGFGACLESLADIARRFRKMGAGAVCLKGGHLPAAIRAAAAKAGKKPDPRLTDYVYDTLVCGRRGDVFYFGSPAFRGGADAGPVHGTGCVLASAAAAMTAAGYTAPDAVAYARAYVTRGIRESEAFGAKSRLFRHGPAGPADLASSFPVMGRNARELALMHEPRPDPFPPCPRRLGFYPVVDSAAWIARLCRAGVKTMQLRVKGRPDPALLEREVAESAALCRESGARLFVDDYADLAARHGAYGVHLGQEDLLTADLDKIRAAGLRLGVSTHGYAEIARAFLVRPSLIALGHVYPTASKAMESRPQGPERLRDYVALAGSAYPTVAIGGIKLGNLGEVLASGTGSVAVITAITRAASPDEAVKVWLERAGRGDPDPETDPGEPSPGRAPA